MPDWLASRTAVIVLAVAGALLALAASLLDARGRGRPEYLKALNRAGYGCMWTSVALFIYAGFRSGY